ASLGAAPLPASPAAAVDRLPPVAAPPVVELPPPRGQFVMVLTLSSPQPTKALAATLARPKISDALGACRGRRGVLRGSRFIVCPLLLVCIHARRQSRCAVKSALNDERRLDDSLPSGRDVAVTDVFEKERSVRLHAREGLAPASLSLPRCSAPRAP